MNIPCNVMIEKIVNVISSHIRSRETEYRSDYDLVYCVVSVALGITGSYAANQLPNVRLPLTKDARRADLERLLEMLESCDFQLTLSHSSEKRAALRGKIEASIPSEVFDKGALATDIVDEFFSEFE